MAFVLAIVATSATSAALGYWFGSGNNASTPSTAASESFLEIPYPVEEPPMLNPPSGEMKQHPLQTRKCFLPRGVNHPHVVGHESLMTEIQQRSYQLRPVTAHSIAATRQPSITLEKQLQETKSKLRHSNHSRSG